MDEVYWSLCYRSTGVGNVQCGIVFLHAGDAAQCLGSGFVRAGEEAEGSSVTLTRIVGSAFAPRSASQLALDSEQK